MHHCPTWWWWWRRRRRGETATPAFWQNKLFTFGLAGGCLRSLSMFTRTQIIGKRPNQIKTWFVGFWSSTVYLEENFILKEKCLCRSWSEWHCDPVVLVSLLVFTGRFSASRKHDGGKQIIFCQHNFLAGNTTTTTQCLQILFILIKGWVPEYTSHDRNILLGANRGFNIDNQLRFRSDWGKMCACATASEVAPSWTPQDRAPVCRTKLLTTTLKHSSISGHN